MREQLTISQLLNKGVNPGGWGIRHDSPHLGMGMVLRWCRGVSMKCYHIL